MNKKILQPLIIGAMALVLLFVGAVGGLTVPPSKLDPNAQTEEHNHDHDHEAPPMMQRPEMNFAQYLEKTKKKLHPQILQVIEKLESDLSNAKDNHAKGHALESLGKQWYDIKRYEMAAYYFVEYGILENSEKYLTFASQIVNDHIQTIQEDDVKFWMGDNGVRALKKLVEMHPEDKDLKMELALMYIDNAGLPMNGVAELQAVVAADSSDFRANMILGEMAIQSRQFDKAVERCKLIIKHHPKSWEARVIMAYAYHNLNQNEKAIQLLNEAKELNTTAEFRADVDKYLETIK